VKPGFLIVALCASAGACASAGIDFTPTVTERTLQGIKFKQLNFTDNERRVTYEQPRGWKYSGGGASIKFIPPDLALAEAEISQAPLPAPIKLDDETMKALTARVMASVPKDSKNVTVLSEDKNPFRINQQETYAVTISYTVSGQEFQRWVLFLNLPDNQLRFHVAATKGDFEKVQKAFRASLFSWQWK
jgi:hypothetical protein